MNEKEHIRKIKRGNEQAFRLLVDTYKNLVFSACYHMVETEDDAEDLSQEVFIEVYRSIGAFKGQSKLSTWVYSIALSKAKDFVKYKSRQKRDSDKNVRIEQETQVIQISDYRPNGEDLLVNADRMKTLKNALNALPPRQKSAFTLVKIEGYSYQETADLLSISVSSVESLLFRANKGLRTSLQSYYISEFG